MERLTIPVRGGNLICQKSADPENPGVSISYIPNGIDVEIDIVYIENTQMELGHSRDPEDLRVMIWDDVFNEDYNHHHVISGQDVRELADILKNYDE